MVGVLAALLLSPRFEFMVGGGLVNIGFRLQDRLSHFDFEHDESITPDQIWAELERQNDLAADVRDIFPRTSRHPVVAILACMDARIDTSELVGDTRRYYYVVRTAGSVLSPAEQEMLELAVINGVKIILLTTHTDCAAEGAAADPELRKNFPALTALMDERVRRVEEFMARPTIRDAIAAGELQVKHARIDTSTDRLVVEEVHHDAPLTREASLEHERDQYPAFARVVRELLLVPAMGLKRARHEIGDGDEQDERGAKRPGRDGESCERGDLRQIRRIGHEAEQPAPAGCDTLCPHVGFLRRCGGSG